MAFELPALAYATDALEPHIDKTTMEIHHGKHHQAYVDNLNKALAGTDGANQKIEDIIKNISKYPMPVRNNGGGHFNHTLYWSIMSPNGGGTPSGDLEWQCVFLNGTWKQRSMKAGGEGRSKLQ